MRLIFPFLLVFCGRGPVTEPMATAPSKGTIKNRLRGMSLTDLARLTPFIRYSKEFLDWHTHIASEEDKDLVTNKIMDVTTNWLNAQILGHEVTPLDLFGNNKKRVFPHAPLSNLYEFRPKNKLRTYHTYKDGNILFLWGGTKSTQKRDFLKAAKILKAGAPSLP